MSTVTISKIAASKCLEAYKKHTQDLDKKVNILVYGSPGTGKTRLAVTCRKPVVIFNFDPQGTETLALQPLIQKGEIIVFDFSQDNTWTPPARNQKTGELLPGEKRPEPYAFNKFINLFKGLKADGFFDHVGTTFFDSLTGLAYITLNRVMQDHENHKVSSLQPNGTPGMADYGAQLGIVSAFLREALGLPCNVILTGHIKALSNAKGDIVGKALQMSGQQSTLVPCQVLEQYVSTTRVTNGKREFVLQTGPANQLDAKTRIGEGIFALYETPDINDMLKRANRYLPDKPPLDIKFE